MDTSGTGTSGTGTSGTGTSSGPSVRIAPEHAVTTVVERFACEEAAQPDALARATTRIEGEWLAAPGFVAAVLLRGRDHGGVVAYSQWSGAQGPDAQAPAAVPTAWSLTPVMTAQLLDARTFVVDFAAAADAVVPLSREGTPLVHFGVFTMPADRQQRLLDVAREHAPRSLEVTPGLVAIHFHRSLDGGEVLNLGTWTTFEHFAALLATPGFRDDSVYWAGIADFAPDFFDVVSVHTAG